MAPKYNIGQNVIITPVKGQHLSTRDCDIGPYAGKTGEVIDYYWIGLGMRTAVFYIYVVRVEDSDKEIVLHEDELQPYIE